MQAHAAQPNPLTSYAITAAVIALVFAFRWRRMSRTTPLRIGRLWVFPAIYAVIAVSLFAATPPTGLGWLFCLVALVLGAALGWQRGKMMRITVDPETHALNQTASPAAVLLLLVLIAVRSGAKAMLANGAGPLHLDALAVTDMLVALALGLFTAMRVEMYLRAKRLLLEAQRRVFS